MASPTSPSGTDHERDGFTLNEILIVIGITALLATIIIVSVNPIRDLAQQRNNQRRSDVNAIMNAVYDYAVDHYGVLPQSITTSATEICRSDPQTDCTGLINLNVLTGAYIPAMPTDPKAATVHSTRYTIMQLGNRVTVAAPYAEQNELIIATR